MSTELLPVKRRDRRTLAMFILNAFRKDRRDGLVLNVSTWTFERLKVHGLSVAFSRCFRRVFACLKDHDKLTVKAALVL